jgi:hypothetical protein
MKGINTFLHERTKTKKKLNAKNIGFRTLTLIFSATFSKYCLFGLLACFGKQH